MGFVGYSCAVTIAGASAADSTAAINAQRKMKRCMRALRDAVAFETLKLFGSDVAQVAQYCVGVLAEHRRTLERHARIAKLHRTADRLRFSASRIFHLENHLALA